MSPETTTSDGAAEGGPITRDQIEAKLRDLQGGVSSATETARPYALAAAAALGLVVVGGAYWFGRRSARKKVPVVEVRRV